MRELAEFLEQGIPDTPKDPYRLSQEETVEVLSANGPKTKRIPNHLYFVRCGPFVKIGIAADVRKRVKDMEMHNPYDLEITHVMLGKRKEEKELHQRFSAYRHKGEWFRYQGELREYVEGLINDASA